MNVTELPQSNVWAKKEQWLGVNQKLCTHYNVTQEFLDWNEGQWNSNTQHEAAEQHKEHTELR